MTRPSLKSRFGEQIRAFVGYKNSLGFPYDESIRILGRFDDFCVERFPEKDCLDCELALAWLEKRDTENTAGHRNRIMVIREFAKYLRAVGTEAYMIPISMTSKGPGYVPHIFNEAEIKAFFHGADSFRPHGKAPARHLVIPVFYRLLYCCGLRPAEARLLKKENVDLVRGSVYVVESKGHKDRVVAVADDLLQIMRSYSTLISEIYPDSDYFFPRYDGEGPYTKRWTEEMFWRCFSMAGITAFEGPKPRVYDFRHTFATECICRWMREGRDIDAMLPFLSAYMGHARYEDTLYYVHMVPDFYERVGTVDRTAWEKLLPEVHDEGYDDSEGKVVATVEQDDMKQILKTFHEWYNEGIINSDAATRPEDANYKACSIAQGWSGAAITSWGPQLGVECVAQKWGPTIVSNETVRGSLNCISANCANPEKALQFLQLVNTDTYVRDLFYYGVQGDNWDYTDDSKTFVHKNNADWSMAGYTQGSFFAITPTDDFDFNQFDEVKELNEKAEPSVLLGFTLDTTPIADELANCIQIAERYKGELLTGTADPEVMVPQMMQELRAAGFDKIVAEAQSQVDAFMATNK